MQQIQELHSCWKHLQNFCVSNSASAVCDCSWIVMLSILLFNSNLSFREGIRSCHAKSGKYGGSGTSHVIFVQIFLCRQSCLNRNIVLIVPLLRTFCCTSSQTLQNISVEMLFTVWPWGTNLWCTVQWVPENSQHMRLTGPDLSGFLWEQRWWTLPLRRRLLLWFRVVSLNPHFSTSDYLRKEIWVSEVFWRPWYTLTQLCFFSFVSRQGMGFAAVCHIVRSFVKTLCHDSDEISIALAKSQIVTLMFPWTNSLFVPNFHLFCSWMDTFNA
jgi:hypothetical protein